MTAVDPATGLPQLPENHVWEVRKLYKRPEIRLINLKPRSKWAAFWLEFFGNSSEEVLRSEYFTIQDQHPTKDEIIEAAFTMYDLWQNDIASKKLYGYYPPNTLES